MMATRGHSKTNTGNGHTKQENEILEILGDPFDGRIGTQFVGDEITVNAGIRSADLTRRIVMFHNAHDKLVEASIKAANYFRKWSAELTEEFGEVEHTRILEKLDAALALTEVRQ